MRFRPVRDPSDLEKLLLGAGSDWSNKLHACVGGELFLYALEGHQRVLDIGCGEGWLSLHLARSVPEVVELDVLPEQIVLAENAARLLGVENVRFEVSCAADLSNALGSSL